MCSSDLFDLLYWNADSTRMPAAMHSFYLRQMYQENRLVTGDIKLLGTRIDLTKIKIPVYILSTREDHIAPWRSTYAATQIYKGKTEFVLSASGHIAGVVLQRDHAHARCGHLAEPELQPRRCGFHRRVGGRCAADQFEMKGRVEMEGRVNVDGRGRRDHEPRRDEGEEQGQPCAHGISIGDRSRRSGCDNLPQPHRRIREGY